MLKIDNSDSNTALTIMHEVSKWLLDTNQPLWNPDDFVNGTFLKTINNDDLYTACLNDEPVAAMVLQWSDPLFWPKSINDSGFDLLPINYTI